VGHERESESLQDLLAPAPCARGEAKGLLRSIEAAPSDQGIERGARATEEKGRGSLTEDLKGSSEAPQGQEQVEESRIMSKKGKGRAGTRAVGYRFEGDFDEAVAEGILLAARKTGVVTEYDTGRGHVVWFNGFPGAELRKVRDQVQSLIKKGAPCT
jgi:hypothetical protein